jgi:stearoyl-CoA desaturase (delta-9 desaturase)
MDGTLHSHPMDLLRISEQPFPVRQGKRARSWRDYELAGMTPFILLHVLAVVGIVLGASWQAWVLCVALYWVRMFFVTGAYHRYFSHRTYKTSRWMQFVLAFMAETTAQRGALWWAAHHRDHHKYSDDDRDVHSPVRWGFWHSQFGWLYDQNGHTDYARVKDLAKYPELVVLNKLWLVPPAIMGTMCWFFLGMEGLLVGFMLSTVLLWHGTFTINSLAHIWGKRRYETTDDSRNNLWLALLTMGEGWHNNHHHFMNSTRQGFFWWEIDMTYYVLKAMSWVGLVWDLKEPPSRVYEPAKAEPAEGVADVAEVEAA